MSESKWHLSKYNISAKIDEEDTWYVVNLYRNTCTPMSAATLYAMANLDELDEDTPLLAKLAKLGIIADFDERASLEAMARMACAFPHSVSITICPTMGCNFDCPYCFEEHRNEKMTRETQDAVIALAERMLDASGAKRLSVSWFGGEPLLAPDVIEYISKRLISMCEDRGIKYSAGIITNGYLLDQKIVDMLEKCRVARAQITLDGIGEVHDRTRHLAGGGPTFEKIASNLKTLKIPFNVNVRHNVHSENKDQQQALKDFIEDIASHSGNKINYYSAPVSDNKASHDRNSELILSCDAENADIGVKLDTARANPAKGHYCGAHILWFVAIDAKGRLHKCWETVDKPGQSFGIVSEWDPKNPVATASNADNLTKFLNTVGATCDNECMDCIWLPVCRGGCPNKRLLGGVLQCVAYKDDPGSYVRALHSIRNGHQINPGQNSPSH